ncbi:hypothetical protein [Luteolibacter marinus]|uniref:hypothetical protein n=1 Tax=Luteolibacter marinus TaxID=2776705 RepID=UPI001D016F9B|nr:hypothetical protein [Luteolibacter marinus]
MVVLQRSKPWAKHTARSQSAYDNSASGTFKFSFFGLSTYAIACIQTVMLSHLSTSEGECETIATATAQLREAAGNHRRPPAFLRKMRKQAGEVRQWVAESRFVQQHFGQIDAAYFRNWFVEGPKRLLRGRFSRRAAMFMIVSTVPGILAALMMTVPGFLFHTPEHHQFYFFARCLEGDSVSKLPLLIGTISSVFGLRFPLSA